MTLKPLYPNQQPLSPTYLWRRGGLPPFGHERAKLELKEADKQLRSIRPRAYGMMTEVPRCHMGVGMHGMYVVRRRLACYCSINLIPSRATVSIWILHFNLRRFQTKNAPKSTTACLRFNNPRPCLVHQLGRKYLCRSSNLAEN